MISIGELFSKTFRVLKGHWFQAICVFFVFNLIIGLVQAIPGIGGFLSLLISGPITIGICVYSLKIINDNFPKAEDVLYGFKYISLKDSNLLESKPLSSFILNSQRLIKYSISTISLYLINAFSEK